MEPRESVEPREPGEPGEPLELVEPVKYTQPMQLCGVLSAVIVTHDVMHDVICHNNT